MREIGCWRSGKCFESLVAVTTLITAYGVCLLLLRAVYVNFTAESLTWVRNKYIVYMCWDWVMGYCLNCDFCDCLNCDSCN